MATRIELRHIASCIELVKTYGLPPEKVYGLPHRADRIRRMASLSLRFSVSVSVSVFGIWGVQSLEFREWNFEFRVEGFGLVD